MEDPRMQAAPISPMPFDGELIFGGFEMIVDA